MNNINDSNVENNSNVEANIESMPIIPDSIDNGKNADKVSSEKIVDNDKKKLKSLKWVGAFSLIFYILGFAMIGLFLFQIFDFAWNNPEIVPDNFAGIASISYLSAIVLLLLASLLSLVGGIIILATNWSDKVLNDKKIIWGILAIVVLGPIAVLVFANFSK